MQEITTFCTCKRDQHVNNFYPVKINHHTTTVKETKDLLKTYPFS